MSTVMLHICQLLYSYVNASFLLYEHSMWGGVSAIGGDRRSSALSTA